MRYWIAAVALTCSSLLHAEIATGATIAASVHGQAQLALDPPAIAIARELARVKVTFAGTLESADSPGGPWSAVPNSASPFSSDLAGPQRFYRAREATTSSVFSSRSVLSWTITGPLQQHFDLAFAGTPDGIFPPLREKLYFDGFVRISGFEIPVSLRVRGNSSLQECPFPKLKLKVSAKERVGTPFFDAREIKIGTHCAEGGRGNIGRLRDERAAFREALAYEMMEAMGFISPRVRRARIEYRDTSPKSGGSVGNTVGGSAGAWPVTRNAVMFDDIEVVAERLGGRALSDEEVAVLTKAGFDEQLVAELQLLHALLGNWDYALSPDGQGLRNTEVIELPNKQLVPVAGDFDLASLVTGEVRLSAPRDYRPDLPDLERQALHEVEQTQQRASAPGFAAAIQRFLLHRQSLESVINAGELDEDGRNNALRHLQAFFDALSAIQSLGR